VQFLIVKLANRAIEEFRYVLAPTDFCLPGLRFGLPICGPDAHPSEHKPDRTTEHDTDVTDYL